MSLRVVTLFNAILSKLAEMLLVPVIVRIWRMDFQKSVGNCRICSAPNQYKVIEFLVGKLVRCSSV